jgi:hypothetical protein
LDKGARVVVDALFEGAWVVELLLDKGARVVVDALLAMLMSTTKIVSAAEVFIFSQVQE